MRAGIQQDVAGAHVMRQAAGIIILLQHALGRQDPITKHANGIQHIIIATKHIVETTQIKPDVWLLAVNGIVIIVVIYHVTILIIQTKLRARTIRLIYHVLGIRLTAILLDAGIIIHNLFVRHNQNAYGKLHRLQAGAKN